MARAFATITFTPEVKAAQERFGSRAGYAPFESAEADERALLTPREADFIAARDSMYQATVNEHGWPYVQHRGGPVGFLKVLDERTIGYADFRGNRQYLSVGNLSADNRVSLILMDYVHQRRLKLWGHARLADAQQEPELIAKLTHADYQAKVERGVIITVAAYDWNCPQHITPRFTEAEVVAQVEPLVRELADLREKYAALKRKIERA